MPVEQYNAKRRVLLDPVPANTADNEGWTPIAVPIACNFVGQRNAGEVTVQQCTDPANDDSFDELVPSWSDPIQSPTPGAPRFPAGTIVMYLRVLGGNVQGDVRFHFVF